MNQKFTVALVACAVSAVVALASGCDRVKQFRDLVDGGTEALMKEDSAYRVVKSAAAERGDRSIQAIQSWLGTLNNVKAVMIDANKKLKGKNESKIRADKDVQAALSQFRAGVDQVLGRNYAEAALRLVPPWRMADAQAVAAQVPNVMLQINTYYATVFATVNPYAGKTFAIDVIEDTQVLDTYGPCIERVEMVSKGQAKNSYCVSAARSSCSHQTNLGCVESNIRAALADNTCPDVKTLTYKIPAGEQFRPERYIDANTEEVKEWKYGQYVTEPNPDRNFGTFCPSSTYDASIKGVPSTTFCGFGPKARIYGYDEKRHVRVEIEGVRHSDDSRKDVIVDIYAEGSFVGTRVIRSDYGWTNNVYEFEITERAFQLNSMVKLQFRDLINVSYADDQGQYRTKKAHWIVEAQIKGEDVPFLRKREVHLTKYTPNTWVGGIVRSCASATPILK